MCKLFAIVEIENQKNAERFAKAAIPFITKTDNHGLGIMRLGENGVHIQRWLEPPTVVRKKPSKAMVKYQKALRHQHNEEGRPSRRLDAIAIHGRFATCERSMENTHPFYKEGAALMHNGVITNAALFTQTVSTCDSEAILSQYIEKGVRDNALELGNSLDDLMGYYAAIVFNDNGTIDIWRDRVATLWLAHIRGVGVVIATTQEIILSTAKRRKAYVSGIDEVLPFTAIRWTNGLYPQIREFAVTKSIGNSIETVPNSIQFDSSASDYQKHWWEHAELESELGDPELKRIREWKRIKEEETEELSKLYDGRNEVVI